MSLVFHFGVKHTLFFFLTTITFQHLSVANRLAATILWPLIRVQFLHYAIVNLENNVGVSDTLDLATSPLMPADAAKMH